MIIDGDPNLIVRLNHLGTGGAFTVRSDGTPGIFFRVEDSGTVELFGELRRFGAPTLNNSKSGLGDLELLRLQQRGDDRFDFYADASENFAQIKASTSGWALRMRGDAVELNATGTSGPVRLRSSGTEYVTFTYDTSATPSTSRISGAGLVEISGEAVSLNATGATGPVRLRRGGIEYVTFTYHTGSPKSRMSAGKAALEVAGDIVYVNSTSETAGSVRLQSDGNDYVTFSVDNDGPLRVSTMSANPGILKVSGGEVVVHTPSMEGILSRCVWNTTQALDLSYGLAVGGGRSVIFRSNFTAQLDHVSIQHSSARDVLALVDRTGEREALGLASHFQVRFGRDSTLLFEVSNEGGGTTFYGDDGSAGPYVSAAQITTVTGGSPNDALFTLGGGTLRARLMVNFGASSPGVIGLQDRLTLPWYFWADTDGLLRVKDSDPGSAGGGYAVGAKQRVVAKVSSYDVQASECDTIFTNAGAPAAITFTLPTAVVGLRYLFVVATTTPVTVAATGLDLIVKDGVDALSRSADAENSFISVVCIKGGKWLVDRFFNF